MNEPISPGPTGPRTEEGKARSSRNATRHGFYAERACILPGEEDEFARLDTALMTELSPEGVLEQVLAEEIMTATWRLRRCGIIEAKFADAPDPDDKTQRAVDRARAHSHNIIRRSSAELRRLQTERAIRAQLGTTGVTPGLADTLAIHRALNSVPLPEGAEDAPADAKPTESLTMKTLEALMAQADKQLCAEIRENVSSFRKPATPAPASSHKVGRNEPCPCRSGLKYKRCCGNPAAVRRDIAA
ncbi:MAG TPA: SEC-C metal-binding domain-containing protein [Bryobacteraceae bacterium]|nr:SEC-C metal-binding domain-containing protein [Bryobacteraceae bacterium]